jgi:hypothetical protein
MTNATAPKTTVPYMIQAGIAFSIALVTMIVGQLCLPVSPWTRAFLALGTTFLVSSAFTLAKCIRDQQETGSVLNRIDQARLDRLLAEFDPFHVTPLLQPISQLAQPPSTVASAPNQEPYTQLYPQSYPQPYPQPQRVG